MNFVNRLRLFPLKVAKLSDPVSFISEVIEFIFIILRPDLLFNAKQKKHPAARGYRVQSQSCAMHNHKWLCADTSITSAHTEQTPNYKENSQAIQDVDFFIIIIRFGEM